MCKSRSKNKARPVETTKKPIKPESGSVAAYVARHNNGNPIGSVIEVGGRSYRLAK